MRRRVLADGSRGFIWRVEEAAAEAKARTKAKATATHHGGVFLDVGGRHDFDAAVCGHDKLLFVKRDGFAVFWGWRRLVFL